MMTPNYTKFIHLIIWKIIKNYCHQMSHFKAKMHHDSWMFTSKNQHTTRILNIIQ